MYFPVSQCILVLRYKADDELIFNDVWMLPNVSIYFFLIHGTLKMVLQHQKPLQEQHKHSVFNHTSTSFYYILSFFSHYNPMLSLAKDIIKNMFISLWSVKMDEWKVRKSHNPTAIVQSSHSELSANHTKLANRLVVFEWCLQINL